MIGAGPVHPVTASRMSADELKKERRRRARIRMKDMSPAQKKAELKRLQAKKKGKK
jgi:hypothetical protein